MSFLSIPLAILELPDKTHATMKMTLLKVFDSFNLNMKFCLCGTVDEADKDVISGLERSRGYPVSYIPDPGHLISTCVKHAAKDSLVEERLFEPTKLAIQAIRSKYGIRQLYNDARQLPAFFVEGKPCLELKDWSPTRLIGALLAGDRFCQNI